MNAGGSLKLSIVQFRGHYDWNSNILIIYQACNPSIHVTLTLGNSRRDVDFVIKFENIPPTLEKCKPKGY